MINLDNLKSLRKIASVLDGPEIRQASSLQSKELTFVIISSNSLAPPTQCMTYLNDFVMNHSAKGSIAKLMGRVAENGPAERQMPIPSNRSFVNGVLSQNAKGPSEHTSLPLKESQVRGNT
ncbi:hypothetical protein CCH79_00007718 [Gambusia affinis]|uniref:Uncharacterized protein n=1 Tax=Gambusia affinis TaxID=33528 RepID=A0A315W1I4_GAMAF|nr:hypothetical protein CCH79_00007718 [Gambusia affinis]